MSVVASPHQTDRPRDEKMTTKISVLICTRDRPDTVGQAIESVASCDYPLFDVHVMDQSTTDATRRIVEALTDRFADRVAICYHHLDKAGLSRAYNIGMSVTDAPVVACTDDDVIVPPVWLSRIALAFDSDPRLGLLYGQVLVPESLRGAEEKGLVVPCLGWDRRERLWHGEHNFKVWGMGANMAVRRAAFEQVGGFDEALGGGAPLRSSQDFDFSFRTYRSGYAVLLEPDVTVDHYGTRTLEQWPGTMRNYAIGNGAFYWKHIRCGDLLALWWLLMKLGRLVGQAIYRSGRARRWVGVSPYARHLFTGIRDASRFGVDRQRRLFRETSRAQITVTEANLITGAARESG
jgi:glycosyltransferase involved in cell wall biosynthesis